MLEGIALALTSSYIAWFFKHNESQAIYPFESDYSAPADPRLSEMRLETPDGETLIVWVSDPAPDRPVVFYLSGNAGTLSDRLPRFSSLIDLGFGLVAPAYRGSSGSTGRPEESLLTSDAELVADFAGTRGASIVLYGESLGAALAIKLAAEGMGDAVVLEAPFTTFPELVDAQFPLEDLGRSITQRWDSRERISDVVQPMLVVHGRDDRLVPQEMGLAIFSAARSLEKRFLDVDDAGHRDLWASPALGEIIDFLALTRQGND